MSLAMAWSVIAGESRNVLGLTRYLLEAQPMVDQSGESAEQYLNRKEAQARQGIAAQFGHAIATAHTKPPEPNVYFACGSSARIPGARVVCNACGKRSNRKAPGLHALWVAAVLPGRRRDEQSLLQRFSRVVGSTIARLLPPSPGVTNVVQAGVTGSRQSSLVVPIDVAHRKNQ